MKLPLALTMAGSVLMIAACDRNKTEDVHHESGVDELTEQNGVDQPVIDKDRDDVEERVEDKKDDMELIRKSTATLGIMKKDPGVAKLIESSTGVFIVPEYGRGAVGVGARGGEGVLVAHRGGPSWSSPAFYDIGGVSVGAQLGAEGGHIAMILMSDQALQAFADQNKFSINADAKLTVVDYSSLKEASLGKDAGNVVFWSDTAGVFAGVSLSATDIKWDDQENAAYYGKVVQPKDVIAGRETVPKNELQTGLSEI